MIRVKICGITRREDAMAAVEAGADAIGLVFYAKSSRCVRVEQARKIVAALPPLVSTVGLFVNAPRTEIAQTVAAVGLDLIQLHGDETPADCLDLPRRVIRAARVASEADLAPLSDYAGVSGLLLDAKVEGAYGGTGQRFDWSILGAWTPPRPLILAGGLDAENVAEAVRTVRPFAVDVSSGVEAAPGVKDHDKVRRFVAQARTAIQDTDRGTQP